jgi:uncharacterized protein YwlG (UPF0340 family)
MTRRVKRITLSVVILSLCGIAAGAQLEGILKGGGIAFLVSKFGKDINKAINDLTRTKGATTTYATKVVPILSVGQGTEVGAAQIMGPNAAVNKVVACAQLETGVKQIGVRVRALVPIASKNLTDIKRVPGVGISGLVDVKL